MVKRAKLTLEPDPVEKDEPRTTDVPPEAVPESEIKETVAKAPKTSAKSSGIIKTVLFAGLTIVSVIIFKRKIF